MLHTALNRVLLKQMKLKMYRYQQLQHVTAQDQHFAVTFFQDLKMLSRPKIVFSDEATFHLSGNVN
jgi:hypothetical protein